MENSDTNLRRYIEKLPKAELHLHLEGSITPSRFSLLSKKYSSEFSTLTETEIAEQVFEYKDFPDFLNTYKTACQHLRSPEDYLSLLEDLVDQLLAQNVQHAEIIVTPTIPLRFGFDAEDILGALFERSAKLEARKPLQILWIFDCVRQWGRESAETTAQWAARFQSRGVVALGLGGDENSLPASEFEEVFAWARAHSLFAHVHAGEVGEPHQIWDALEILGANRIGHGIQAARDSRLMEYLKERTVGLDVCLTSNVATGAWSTISKNPFWLLHKRGVPVTLNTDDPGLFKTTLNDEYCKAARHFGLGLEDLNYLAIQGIRSSFLPHEEKMELMQKFQSEIAAM